MKKKYIVILSILFITLLFSIGLHTTYSIWNLKNKDTSFVVQDSGCVEIIYSDDQDYNLIKPTSLSDSDAKMLSARSISINNYCDYQSNVELVTKIYNISSLESSKIKVLVNGDVNVNATMLNQLKVLENKDDSVKEKRLLYKGVVAPNETIRLNLRMWLDSQVAITSDKNAFYSEYYVTTVSEKVKMTVSEKVLQDNGGIDVIKSKAVEDFSVTSETDEGLITFGDSYYFRGNVSNNYLKLGDLLFRVVAINSDKSLKIAYLNNDLYSKFNTYSYLNESVGFKDSDINKYMDDWYNNNLSEYDKYISTYNYCNDTSYTTYYAKTIFGALTRLVDNDNPTLECLPTNKDYGGVYTGKVGMLTADEIVIAGGSAKNYNNNFYLYNGKTYYTISPYYYYYGAYLYTFESSGILDKSLSNYNGNVVPVINLDNKVNLKGDGTIDVPYELDITE